MYGTHTHTQLFSTVVSNDGGSANVSKFPSLLSPAYETRDSRVVLRLALILHAAPSLMSLSHTSLSSKARFWEGVLEGVPANRSARPTPRPPHPRPTHHCSARPPEFRPPQVGVGVCVGVHVRVRLYRVPYGDDGPPPVRVSHIPLHFIILSLA